MSGGSKRAEDSINTFAIVTIGVVSTFLVWASIVALQAYYGATGSALEQAREVEGQEVQKLQVFAEQRAQLNPEGLDIVDKDKGLVRVPVAKAMDEVVKTLSENPAASAVPMVGEHDTSTVPAIKGGPVGKIGATPAPTDEPEGDKPDGDKGEETDAKDADKKPADDKPAKPADAKPADAKPATPAPAAPQ